MRPSPGQLALRRGYFMAYVVGELPQPGMLLRLSLGSCPGGGVALERCAVGVARCAHALALVGVGSVEAVGFGGACGAAVGCAAWAASTSADGVSCEDEEALGWWEAAALAGLCRPGHASPPDAQRDPPSGLGLATLTIRVPHEGEHVTHHAAGSPSWMVGTAVRHSGDAGRTRSPRATLALA